MNRIGPKLHSDRPKVVSFGGGKGGTGRSTLCAEVARSIARQNQRVLCVDGSWSCPTLNVLLHAEEPRADFRSGKVPPIGETGSHLADFIVPTANQYIWLANIAAARHFPFVRPRLGADALIAQLHELEFDWVLLDLSPGLDPLDVGLFTLSDIPILVCSPEPASVRMATQYLRSSFYQAIGYHPRATDAREKVLDMLYQQPLEMNLDSLIDCADDSEQVRHVVLDTGRRFETYLVVNLVREGSERDLGYVLCHAWHRELNLFPRLLAAVDYEDRRWFYNRRTTGLGPGRGDEALSKDTEQLAKHLLDISLIDARYPRPVPRERDAHPALQIGIDQKTSRSDIRQHCRRLWEGYRREDSISLVFSDPDDRARITEDLEALYRRVLTMSSDTFDPNPTEDVKGPPGGRSPEGRQDDGLPTEGIPRGAPPAGGLTDESPDGSDAADAADGPAAESPDAQGLDQAPDLPPQTRASASDSAAPNPGAGGPSADSADPSRDQPANSPSIDQLRASTDSPGDMVAALRRNADLSLQDLSKRTYIGIKYLAAIEDVDLEVLPRPVYLRGYLREIAQIFDVEAQPIIDQYFRFLDDT